MGQINLGGANAAVQLQGYTDSSIVTDQAFTFPPSGGQLVCYQQGIWMPTVAGSGKNDPNASGSNGVWAWEGVPNSASGPGGADPFVDPAVFSHTWWRIGNAVTLVSYVSFLAIDPSTTVPLQWRRIPYSIAAPLAGQVYNPFTGTSQNRSTYFSPSSAAGAACSFCPYFWNGDGGGDFVSLTYINGTIGSTNTGATLLSSDVNRGKAPGNQNGYIQWQATYITDDTTWKPQNGATLT